MKNKLKFLLCTICCTVILNDGYSMESRVGDFDTSTEILRFLRGENIYIDYIEITSDCKALKDRIGNIKNIQYKENTIDNYNNEIFDNFPSLKIILGKNYPQNLDFALIKELYDNFNKLVQDKDFSLSKIMRSLLRDNLCFIAKYNTSSYDSSILNSLDLFNLAWSMLIRCIIETRTENDNSYKTLSNLWKNNDVFNDLLGNGGKLKFIDKKILKKISKRVFNVQDNDIDFNKNINNHKNNKNFKENNFDNKLNQDMQNIRAKLQATRGEYKESLGVIMPAPFITEFDYFSNQYNSEMYNIFKDTVQPKTYKYIESLVGKLHTDTINIIFTYQQNNKSLTTNDKNLFSLAWSILLKYAEDNNMQDIKNNIVNIINEICINNDIVGFDINNNTNQNQFNNNHINGKNFNINNNHINNNENKININNNIINNKKNHNQIFKQQVQNMVNELQPILNKYPNSLQKIIPSESLYFFGNDAIIYSMFDTDVGRFHYNVNQLLYQLKNSTNECIENNNINQKTSKLFGLAWNIMYTYFCNNNLMEQWLKHVPSQYVKKIEKMFKNQITEIKNVIVNNNENIKNALSPLSKKDLGLDNRVGLDNVGATCYMNATLQCLANIYNTSLKMLEYGESGKLKGSPNRYKLSLAFFKVLKNIYKLGQNDNKTSYAPNDFKKVLGEMNGLFAPTAANDAKDLLIYFIEQMHTELNKSQENNTNIVMPDNMNSMDRQQVFQCFVNEFKKKYQSVFTDEFYGTNVSVTHCNGCNIEKYSNQLFSFIIFPLLEAEKYRNISIENNNSILPLQKQMLKSQTLNLEDCFKYNQKIERFVGENMMYCNICQASKESTMQTRIDVAPNTLILILNRGKGNLDYKKPFEFWETINLKDYVNLHDDNGDEYYLSGVISHLGDSGPNGHFVAHCRSSKDTPWYLYNDSLVSKSSFNKINELGTPYILFYTKVNKNNTEHNNMINIAKSNNNNMNNPNNMNQMINMMNNMNLNNNMNFNNNMKFNNGNNNFNWKKNK